jgi:hypothetical protein
VAPQASARLAGADEILIRGVGHNALLGDPAVFAAVERELIAAGVAPHAGKEAATDSDAA